MSEEYVRCEDVRRSRFSRNVFCGATSARREPGIPLVHTANADAGLRRYSETATAAEKATGATGA